MDDEYDLRILEHVNEAVLSLLLLGYSLARAARSSLPSYNVFRGKLRALGSLFALGSVLASTTYICLVAYLSTRFSVDRHAIELVGSLKDTYSVALRGVRIDLVYVLNVSLALSKILRMSAVFLLIGLWGPCAYSAFNSGGRAIDVLGLSLVRSVFNTSVATFAKIYALLRIPALVCYQYQSGLLGEKTAVFFESFFLGSEVYLAVGLLVVLRTKHSLVSERGSLDSTNLLSMCLLLHGFLAYTVNTVAVPFEVSVLHHQILQSLKFGVRLILDMLVVSMLCPIRSQLFDAVSEKSRSLEIARISQEYPEIEA